MDNKKITFHTNIKKTATQQPIETTWCVFASDYNSVQVEFVVDDLRPDEIRTVNPTIILIMEDGSTVQRTKEQIIQKNNVFSYKLKDREGQHTGVVKTQLKLATVTGKTYQSNIYTFTILESLDSVPVPKEFVIDDIQNILQEVKHHITHIFKDEETRKQVFADTIKNLTLNEKQRESWFNQSQQTRASLFQVFMDETQEVLKDAQQVKDLFDELTETGVIETNIREKLGELETSYAPRLSTLEQNDVSLTAQLQQTEQELNAQLAQISTQASNFNALQNAIDNTPENGTLILGHNKQYTIDTALNISKNIEIDGQGSILNVNDVKGITGSGVLKSTKTVTVDYVSGDYNITLNDVVGVEIGDLLNIVSTELYDTSRVYYYKGGNVLVTKIDGNKVTLSMPFPFDIPAVSITVKVYKPITVKLKNLKIIGAGILPENGYGIHISYGVSCEFEDIEIDNFCQNISYNRLVNTKVKRVNTGRAKTSSSDAWDGYGHAIASCSVISFEKCNTKSGQHGLTWGGNEVNFGIVIDSCSIDTEVSPYSIGQHENVHDVLIKNSKIYGFSLAGNVLMENCDIFANENNVSQKSNILSSAENTLRANYKFNNCRFNNMIISTADYTQVDAPTRKYIGSIIIDNCKEIASFRTNINYQTAGNKIGEVDLIIVKDCDKVKCVLYDNVKNLTVENSMLLGTGQVISQPVITPQNLVENIEINNCTFDKSYRGIHFNNAGKVKLDNIQLTTVENSNSSFNFNNVNELIIENSDLSGFARGLTLDNITKLTVIGSDIKFYTGLTGASGLKACASAYCKGLNDTTKNCDVFTTPNGSKYVATFNNDGTTTNTLVV